MLKNLIRFSFDRRKSHLSKIDSEENYLRLFEGNSLCQDSKAYKAYEQAWDARKFEIDNYWKRTTYFWAFQVTSFAGYFAIVNSDSYQKNLKNEEILFCVIALGFITALAWSLINIGSKFWQRHWEKHIDMLETDITGPLYKTVFAYKNIKTFSVSKINEIISRFFAFIWIALGTKYCLDHLTWTSSGNIAWIEMIVALGILYFSGAMFFGYGRGRFRRTDFEFYQRDVFKKIKIN